MIEADELIVEDVDEWLDDATHRACLACHTTGTEAGSLAIAYCGTLFRLKEGVVAISIADSGECKACASARSVHFGSHNG